MPDAARGYVRFAGTLSKTLGVLAVAMVCAAILLIIQVIIYRYGLGRSTIWQTEVIIFLIVAATFVGSPHVLEKRGHINVDLLTQLMGERGTWRLELLGGVLSLIFCLAMTYYGTLWCFDAFERGRVTPSIARIPLWIPYLSLPVGMAGLSLQYVANLLEHVYEGRAFADSPEPASVGAAAEGSD